MKNNPLIPFVLIMAFGIGLIIFMSLDGAGKQDEANGGGETTGETAEVDGQAIVEKSCIGCHGGDLAGQGTAPALTGGLDAEKVKDVLINGQGAMPGGLVKSDAEIEAVAEYISGL